MGKFIELETLIHREYLVVKYADGTLRVPADCLDMLSRFRQVGKRPPELDKMAAKSWSKTKTRVKKNIKKLAVDLLKMPTLLITLGKKNLKILFPINLLPINSKLPKTLSWI